MSKRIVVLLVVLLLHFTSHVCAQTWYAAGRLGEPVTALCANTKTGEIFAGTAQGIYLSADTGKSWKLITAISGITALAIQGDTVLCGTTSGLYIGTGGGTWTLAMQSVWVTSVLDGG